MAVDSAATTTVLKELGHLTRSAKGRRKYDESVGQCHGGDRDFNRSFISLMKVVELLETGRGRRAAREQDTVAELLELLEQGARLNRSWAPLAEQRVHNTCG
jgi:hypothetical protein